MLFRRFIVAAALAGSAFTAELPVRTVVLYKHGVGYFERSGELRSGESARLDFKTSDMNDVLKSLTLEDKSGAKITGLRYDASEPLEQRLADYPFQLGERAAVSTFLDQLKGARIELRVSGETVSGVIFGARAVNLGDKAQEKEQVTLLLDSGDIRTFDFSTISGLKLADPALQRQLKDYLSALAVARSKEKRSVYIDSSDSRSRQITASYMIPTAIWKSSYRLILKDAESMLEGWAIVDNTTGEDWSGVNLALVSGRPISFISKLYEPRYRTRPEAELPEDRNVGPVVYSGAVEEKAMAAMAPPPPMANKSAPALRMRPNAGMAMAEAVEVRADMASSIVPDAAGRELGDLFEYRFSTPVTVRKSESAMLPFLQQKINSRKLLIYSDRGMQNPMNAAEITNSSGKTLDGGPITVFDAGAYAGEALVETFKANDKRLISYGIDLGTRITTNLDSSRSIVREIKYNRGVLMLKNAVQETLTYSIRNIDAKAKTLIIEHPVRTQYKLLNQKPLESTSTAHRFEVKLAANSTEKFAVTEERIFDQGLSISNMTNEQIGVYLQNQALSAEGRRQLEGILDLKRKIADNDTQMRDVTSEVNELVKDQERIKDSMSRLAAISGQEEQTQRYAKQIAQMETQIAGMRDRIAQFRRNAVTLTNQLNALLEKMAF